jgi:hypothetical protein
MISSPSASLSVTMASSASRSMQVARYRPASIDAAGQGGLGQTGADRGGDIGDACHTNLLARKEGDPLPRLALDGIATVEFEAGGLCRELRLWWHSRIDD